MMNNFSKINKNIDVGFISFSFLDHYSWEQHYNGGREVGYAYFS